jgi:hypothetical protein
MLKLMIKNIEVLVGMPLSDILLNLFITAAIMVGLFVMFYSTPPDDLSRKGAPWKMAEVEDR